MGLPFESRTRNVTRPGVPAAERVCAVPEIFSSHTNSGRAPRTVKLTHWVVPFRQAAETVCCPGVRGPTERDFEAMPFAPVIEEDGPTGAMPLPGCQAMVWAGAGRPLVSVRACVVQLTTAPAATDKVGVRAAR